MNLKRLCALLLAAALLGGLPVLAAGGEAPAPEGLFLLGEASEYGEVPVESREASAAEAPAFSGLRLFAAAPVRDGAATSFDPRDSGLLTPVRAQGAWNTCWAMASIGAAELDGLSGGLLSAAQSVDLSERHLIYFFTHQADDPLGNSSRDYNVNPSFWIRTGGNPVIAAMTMAGWHGPAEESATGSPYAGLSVGDALDGGYAYADVLHLENTYSLDVNDASGREALKGLLREHGGAVLCLYYNADYLFAGSPSAQTDKTQEPDSAEPGEPGDAGDPMDPPATDAGAAGEPDPSGDPEPAGSAPEDPESPPEEPGGGPVPEEDTPPAEAPEPASGEGDAPLTDEDAGPLESETPLPEGLDGAADLDAPAADGAEADDFTVCYYQNSLRTTNHEVVVVGWDDGYPAQNFGYSPAGAVPPGDGAWLCRNSQGPNWAGGDGYFWVSYYDLSAAASTGGSISGRVTVFDFGPADNYDNNYEYDGAAILGYVNDAVNGKGVSTTDADSSTRRWYANVFTACGNAAPRGTETLRAVSTYTYRPGVSYTVRVYTDLASAADPASGTLAAETAGTFRYAGYHTVSLPRGVLLQEGETFAVVFSIGEASDHTLFVPACCSSSNWYSTNETLAGQSFVSMDGASWLDGKTLQSEPNVRIKAFTDNTDPVFPFTDVDGSAWYYEDVHAAWLRSLVNGMTATTYGPASTATRAQVVTVLWRLAGEPAPSAPAAFTDVRAGLWYSDAVAWADENGVVNGYTDGRFLPSNTITRQEFLTILYRYAALRGQNVSQTADLTAYRDGGSVAPWARDAMAWSLGSGLQRGVATATGITLLDPRGSVTRAQLAAFLRRFADLGT